MDRSQVAAFGTAILLIAVTFASGLLISPHSPADSRAKFDPSSGSIDASVVSTPDRVTVEYARFDADVAHLNAPPVQLDISNVSHQPTISYKLRIDELTYATSTVSFLDASVAGRYAL
jgi:hypothetical protein